MIKEFKQHGRLVWAIMAHVLIAAAAVMVVGTVLYHSISVVVMLFLAVVLALLLNPVVEALTKPLPRWLAILLIYVCIVGALVALGIWLVPLLIKQGNGLVRDWPLKLQPRLLDWYDHNVPQKLHEQVDAHIPELQRQFQAATKGGMEKLVGISLGGARITMSVILTLVMSIYLLADRDHFVRWFQGVTPASNQARLQGLFNDVVGVLRAYIRGLAVMVVFVGVAVSLLLWAFHIPYWLAIGVVAGVLEVIPYFGAAAGAIPAVILGFSHSTTTGIILIIGFIVINQVEGHVVAPLAMGHSMHLRPLAVLLSLLAGAEVHGVLGMIVAVPVVGIVRVMWEHGRKYLERNSGGSDSPKIIITGDGRPEGNGTSITDGNLHRHPQEPPAETS